MLDFVIGTAQFGQVYGICNQDGAVEQNQADLIVESAISHGISIFDTARLYGESEFVLGQALARRDPECRAKVITKYYINPDSPEDVFQQFSDSLAFLGEGRIDGVLVHNADVLLGGHGNSIWGVLGELKNTYAIPKIGVSVYEPDIFKELARRYPLELVQCPCNILDQRFLHTDVQALKRERGIEFHARSLFLQGVLLRGSENLPDSLAHKRSAFFPVSDYLNSRALSGMELCLLYAQWTQKSKLIDRWVFGVDSKSQLEEIMRSLNALKERHNLSETDFAAFNSDDLDLIDPRLWGKS